jgi:hypothetical protein
MKSNVVADSQVIYLETGSAKKSVPDFPAFSTKSIRVNRRRKTRIDTHLVMVFGRSKKLPKSSKKSLPAPEVFH